MTDTKWLFQQHDALRNHIECLATFGSTEPEPFYRAIDKALVEARAQGAAEERERLAKCADAYSSTDLYDINDGGCQFLSRSEWRDTAQWLRSQKDQHHD